MTQREILQQALDKTKRVLAKLEEQLAGYGSLNAPAHLLIELEDQKLKVAELEARQLRLDNTWNGIIGWYLAAKNW